MDRGSRSTAIHLRIRAGSWSSTPTRAIRAKLHTADQGTRGPWWTRLHLILILAKGTFSPPSHPTVVLSPSGVTVAEQNRVAGSKVSGSSEPMGAILIR